MGEVSSVPVDSVLFLGEGSVRGLIGVGLASSV
jgi:hypothetical protein